MSTLKQVTETNRDPQGRWLAGSSPNPKGRPPNAEQIRKLLEPHKEELVKKAVEKALSGDGMALKICLDRLSPPHKPENAPVQISDFSKAQGIKEKAEALIDAIAHGELSPDIGERLLNSVVALAKIIEIHDLEERLSILEKRDSEGTSKQKLEL